MAEVVALGEVLIDFAQKSKDVEGYPTMAAHAGGIKSHFLSSYSLFTSPYIFTYCTLMEE